MSESGVKPVTLTEKQNRFCDEYLIDLNATQAAIRAGYSGKNARNIASENLAKPNIKKYIEDRMAQKATKLIADQDEVLKYLTGVMRNEESEEVVIVEGTGDGCSEARVIKKDASIKDRVKAAELLGKRYSLFTDKVDLNADMDLKITVDYGEDEND